MNTRAVAYWTTTGLFSAALGMSGLATLSRQPPLVAAYQHLGYPLYFMSILGAAKLLGVLTLLAPGLPRLKEWAYAGFTFVLLGATASHLFSGDAIGVAAFPAALLLPLAVSYQLRHARGAVAQAASGLTASLA